VHLFITRTVSAFKACHVSSSCNKPIHILELLSLLPVQLMKMNILSFLILPLPHVNLGFQKYSEKLKVMNGKCLSSDVYSCPISPEEWFKGLKILGSPNCRGLTPVSS